MTPVGNRQLLLEVFCIVEIAEKEHRTVFLDGVRHKLHSLTNISLAALRLEIQQLADNEQDVLPSLLRRDELLHLIREKDDTNLIVVLDSRESQRSSNLCHHLTFGLTDGTEVQTARHIDQQNHGQLPLFLKHLHERLVEASCNVPVDIAHIVTILIFTNFRESHTPTLEGRVVFSSKDIVGESARLDFYLSYLTEQF